MFMNKIYQLTEYAIEDLNEWGYDVKKKYYCYSVCSLLQTGIRVSFNCVEHNNIN